MDVVGRTDLSGIWLLPVYAGSGALAIIGILSAVMRSFPPAWVFGLVMLVAIGFGGVLPVLFLWWLFGRNAVLADDVGLAAVKRGTQRRSFEWSEIERAYWYGGLFWSITPGLAPGGAMVFTKPTTKWSTPVKVGSVLVVRPKRRHALAEAATAYLHDRSGSEGGTTSGSTT